MDFRSVWVSEGPFLLASETQRADSEVSKCLKVKIGFDIRNISAQFRFFQSSRSFIANSDEALVEVVEAAEALVVDQTLHEAVIVVELDVDLLERDFTAMISKHVSSSLLLRSRDR